MSESDSLYFGTMSDRETVPSTNAPPPKPTRRPLSKGSSWAHVELGDYRPRDDEDYMNDRQLAYFHKKLIQWRDEILQGSNRTLAELRDEDVRIPDESDWASAEVQRNFELRKRDRERKLLNKIDAALKRIEDGSYGFCEETWEPIGLKRLDARPIATLSIEAQERHERKERTHREV